MNKEHVVGGRWSVIGPRRSFILFAVANDVSCNLMLRRVVSLSRCCCVSIVAAVELFVLIVVVVSFGGQFRVIVASSCLSVSPSLCRRSGAVELWCCGAVRCHFRVTSM